MAKLPPVVPKKTTTPSTLPPVPKAQTATGLPPVTPISDVQRQQSRTTEEEMKATKAAQDAMIAAAERKRADISSQRQKTGADFSQEVARLAAEEELKQSVPPIYAGGYELGTTTPLFGLVAPARPMNIAVPKTEAPGFLEAMRPQTIAPPLTEAMSARQAGKVFDDSAFSESIADLPADQKKRAVDTHEAFKKAFFKLREMNPVETGVTDEELLKDLRQQITDFETGKGPTLTQGVPNRPDIGGALERQVTPATLQIARPGALTYFSELSSRVQKEGADTVAAKAVADLVKTGVPIMTPIPGNKEGLERQIGTRPATVADIERTKADARNAYIEANPIPLSMLENRDELLANSEKSATGGTLFQKEYITGATAESSLSHALRSAFAIPNYIAGEAIDLVTPESTRAREQAARPAGQKDMSPGVYNVATGGGFMKPIQDLWTYSPVESVRDNAWMGSTFGLAADLLSLEAGAVGGAVSGVRAGLGAAKAAEVAGEASRIARIGTGLTEGAKTAAATTAKSIGLPSVAKAIAPGDIRLLGATSVAENYKAISAYDDVIKAGGDHVEAQLAAEQVSPNSYTVKQMSKQGASFDPAVFIKDSAQQYKEFKAIDDVISAVNSGDKNADVLKLRPYLKAATSDPKVSEAIVVASAGTGPTSTAKFAPTMKATDVVDIIKNTGSLQKVRDAAAFDKGFKALDTVVGVYEPGKEIVAITPRTFGTAKTADEVVKAAADTTAERLFKQVESSRKPEKITFRLGGNDVNDIGYVLKPDETSEFIKVLSKEANTGSIPRNAVNKIIQELHSNTISSSSLRELRYSNVDGVAEEIRVATKTTPGQGTFPIGALAEGSAKSINYGSQTNSITLAMERASKWLSDNLTTSTERLNKLQLNPQQSEIINAGKSKMSEVDKALKAEFNSLSDPEVAKLYGLGVNPTNSQKIAALTLGQNPDSLSKRTTLLNYIKSTIFGTTNIAPSRVLGEQVLPIWKGFEYTGIDDIFNTVGRAKIDQIVDKYQALIKTPDDALKLLPQMSAEVEALTKEMSVTTKDYTFGGKTVKAGTPTSKPAFLSDAFSGKTPSGIYRLQKPEEALIGAYARNKGDQIFSDTLTQVLSYDALTVSPPGQIIAQFSSDLNYNGILQAAVAHQLSGGAPLKSIDDLFKIPAVIAIDRKFFAKTGGVLLDVLPGYARAMGGEATILDDINGTAAVVGRKFGGGPPAIEYATELSNIANGDIAISELGGGANPFSLRNAVRQELGTAAKYGELQSELGKLAEEAASGNKSAVRVNRFVNELFDTYNSFFYNAILSYNPRFHGRNSFYAPSIVHMTTGIGLNPQDMLTAARIIDPGVFDKTAIIVTDRLGNKYTAGELYKIAVESGVLKSQTSASIDARFLDEAAKLGLGDRVFKGLPKKIVNLPSEMANAEDNLWRLATINHALQNGETLEGALRLGKRSLFDFGAATPLERQYIARKIMFYNYFRNSVIQGVRTIVENPTRVLRQYRLVNDMSRINVGDENMNNLRFYAPMDAGVAAVATTYAPKAGKEGKMTVLPNMPYADAAIITAGLMFQPNNFLRGQENLVTGERKFGSGFVYQKLGPATQAIVRGLAGEQIMQDVAIKKNQLSLTHVAAAAALEDGSGGSVPALKALTVMYNVKVRDALPGEEGFEGKVYEMSPDDFEKYKTWIAGTLSMTGTERFISDWGKLFSSAYDQGITGAKSRGFKENIGLTTTTSVETPVAKQTRAAETSAEMLQAETKQKEIDAGLRRPDEPKKAGRIK